MADWTEVLRKAREAAVGELTAGGKGAHAFLKLVAASQRRSLESLLEAVTAGAIDAETFRQELADEQRVMRMELLSAQVIGKKAAQAAANAFFDCIRAALPKAITGLIA